MDNIFDKLVSMVDEFDLATMFPSLDSVVGWAVAIARIFLLAAPVAMLILGLRYRYAPAEKANYSTGYRFFYGMGSTRAWQYTQRLAGVIWTILGAALSVLLLIISLFFGLMDPMTMAGVVIWCMVIELGLVAGSCVYINMQVKKKYDKDGNER